MFVIEIARQHLSDRKDPAGVKMYFDVNLKDSTDGSIHRINGFRLVQGIDKSFLGFPSAVGKDGKRYPTFIPSRQLSEAIQVAAELAHGKAQQAV